MGFRNQAQEVAAQDAAQMEQAKRTCVAEVYSRHQDFVRCEANEKAIIDAIVRWTGNADILPTAELLEIALEADPNSIKEFARQPIARIREQIVEEMLSLLASKNDGRDGKFNSFNLRSEEKRMESWSLDALRNRLNEIKTKQHMAAAPVSVLKSFVADAHRDTNQFAGYPNLPKSMWLDGRTILVDADYLNGLVKSDMYQFKRLVRLYGSQQVDSRRGIK